MIIKHKLFQKNQFGILEWYKRMFFISCMFFLLIFLQLVLSTILQPGQMIEVDTTNASKIQLCMGVDNRCYMSAYDPQKEVWSFPKCLEEQNKQTNPTVVNSSYASQTEVLLPIYHQQHDVIVTETTLLPAPSYIEKEVEEVCEPEARAEEKAEVEEVEEEEIKKPVESSKTRKIKAKNSALDMNVTGYLLLLVISLIAL